MTLTEHDVWMGTEVIVFYFVFFFNLFHLMTLTEHEVWMGSEVLKPKTLTPKPSFLSPN
jgi:hypothetical protein